MLEKTEYKQNEAVDDSILRKTLDKVRKSLKPFCYQRYLISSFVLISVVDQDYTVTVHEVNVIQGNTAILRSVRECVA